MTAQPGYKNVLIEDVNVLGKVITGDGVDIVGCENVVLRNCFIRANDDCISIKACLLYTSTVYSKNYDGFYVTEYLDTRACLKKHSRNLYAPLCGIFCPVSYTHLDVYKRQAWKLFWRDMKDRLFPRRKKQN